MFYVNGQLQTVMNSGGWRRTAAGRWPEAEGSGKRWRTMKMRWTELRLGEQNAH